MKPITREMIKEFKINKLGYDMMGYTHKNNNQLSFHHLIVARRNCKQQGLGEGYLFWNGAILRQDTSHDYLHLIEHIDPEIFYLITSELIDENVQHKITKENLERIRDLLLYFESEHDHDKGKKGNYLIKRHYVEERIPILARERKYGNSRF